MSDEKEHDQAEANVADARRRLLKIGVYAAPIVLTSLTMSRRSWAGSPGHPCDPDTCGPGHGHP